MTANLDFLVAGVPLPPDTISEALSDDDIYELHSAGRDRENTYHLSLLSTPDVLLKSVARVRARIYRSGSPAGFDPVMSYALAIGSPNIANNPDIEALRKYQSIIESCEDRSGRAFERVYSILSDLHNRFDSAIDVRGQRTNKRIPLHVWRESGLSAISAETGVPSHKLAALAIMFALVKQPEPLHAQKTRMKSILDDFEVEVRTKQRIILAILKEFDFRLSGFGGE